MKHLKLVSGILLIIVSFYFFLLSLMNLFPILIAAPLLFASIAFSLSPLSTQKRFKGFR